MTKFHHYILPALPGLGILLGCLLDHLLELRRRPSGGPGGRCRGCRCWRW